MNLQQVEFEMIGNQAKTLIEESKVTISDNNEAPFELILQNPAFKFILNQICETLSVSDMAKCHCVSKRFHEILLNNKPWWIAQLRLMKTIINKIFQICRCA